MVGVQPDNQQAQGAGGQCAGAGTRCKAKPIVARVVGHRKAGYGGDQTWYDGGMLVPLAGAKLLVGDFHADGRADIAVLGRGEAEGSAQLVVLKKILAHLAPGRPGLVTAGWRPEVRGPPPGELGSG